MFLAWRSKLSANWRLRKSCPFYYVHSRILRFSNLQPEDFRSQRISEEIQELLTQEKLVSVSRAVLVRAGGREEDFSDSASFCRKLHFRLLA